MKEVFALIFVLVLLAALIGLGPLITLWAINSLFQLQIAYTFMNWLAALWLGMCLFPTKQYFTKKD